MKNWKRKDVRIIGDSCALDLGGIQNVIQGDRKRKRTQKAIR